MHNGGIAEWERIKRRLQNLLPDEIFAVPQGNTDSEWAFALFLSLLPTSTKVDDTFTPHVLRQAMLDTIKTFNSLIRDAGITEPSLMNFCVTDGETVVATRYISSKTDEAASLYFSSGTTFSEYAPGGHYRMQKLDKRENIIMVASEPLTFEKGGTCVWNCRGSILIASVHSRLDGDPDEHHDCHHTQDEPPPNPYC